MSLIFAAGFVLLSASARKPLFGAIMRQCMYDCPPAVFTLPDGAPMEVMCGAYEYDYSCLEDCPPAAVVVTDDGDEDEDDENDDDGFLCPNTGKPLEMIMDIDPDLPLSDFFTAMCAANPCTSDVEGQFLDPEYYCAHEAECTDALLNLYVDSYGLSDENGVCLLIAAGFSVSCDDGGRKLDNNVPKALFRKISVDMKKYHQHA